MAIVTLASVKDVFESFRSEGGEKSDVVANRICNEIRKDGNLALQDVSFFVFELGGARVRPLLARLFLEKTG
jgi:hypothetical protein